MKNQVAVALILKDNCDMLLLQRKATASRFPSIWEFPGGKVDTSCDKTVADTLAREVKEETSLDVLFATKIQMMPYEFKFADNQTMQCVLHFFLVAPEAWQGDPRPNLREHDNLKWHNYFAIDSINILPTNWQLLRSFDWFFRGMRDNQQMTISL